MTFIVTGVFFLGDPRFRGAETHPTLGDHLKTGHQ